MNKDKKDGTFFLKLDERLRVSSILILESNKVSSSYLWFRYGNLIQINWR